MNIYEQCAIMYCMELVRQCFQEKAITPANKALVNVSIVGM